MSDTSNKPLSGATMIADNLSVPPPTPSAPPSSGTPVPGGAPAVQEAADDLIGAILAERYRVIKKLGEGGMGSVYLAEHTTINKKLAIKVLSPEYSHKQDLVDRFLQEARAASMIEQENVVEITDFGSTPGGSVFFVMEFLNGEDLSDTVKSKGSLGWARVKTIMLQICDALSSAHAAGIIHRDMKPENCYRIKRGSNQDFIKVLDFGIAKVTSDEGDGGRSLTRTGMIFGTPEYMSPEQAKGEKVDHRVDVYATGVIMYELLTGRVPFTADTFMGILTKHMFEAPAAPSTIVPGSVIPHEVEAIILKALQKDREYRFQDMEEMAEAIRSVGDGTGAVAVVQEEVATPTTGQIRFADGSTQMAGAAGFEDDFDEDAGSNKGAMIGLAIAAVVLLGGVGAYAAGLFDGEPPPPKETPVATAPKESKTPPTTKEVPPKTPVPAVDPTPAVADIKIIIKTEGIVAKVFDNADDSELGLTNEEISVPHSSEALDLYIRAEGYEDFVTDLVPDKDKTLTVSLTEATPAVVPTSSKKSPRNQKRGRKGKTKGSATPPPAKKKGASTTPETTPQKDPQPATSDASGKGKGKKGNSISGDLKNPFGKK